MFLLYIFDSILPNLSQLKGLSRGLPSNLILKQMAVDFLGWWVINNQGMAECLSALSRRVEQRKKKKKGIEPLVYLEVPLVFTLSPRRLQTENPKIAAVCLIDGHVKGSFLITFIVK